jgi:membrane associated rhomboid family serine protease
MSELDQLLSAPASLLLLLANIGLSFAAFQNPQLMDRLMFDVGRMRRHGEWYRMFSSGFVHGGPLHLGVNMLGLYSLGFALEGYLGTLPFLMLYLGSLLAGSGWTWMEHFRDMNYRAVGASGAISGLATAFAIFAPLSEFLFLFVFPMPAFIFSGVYIAVSAWAASSDVRDGIGHSAHLGGALAGVAIVCIWWPHAPQQMIDQIVASVRGF